MNNALRMHKHLYLFGLNAEQPLGLNHLEPFVHHRGRVDCYLRTHVPRGMAQGIGLGNFGQLLFGQQAKWASTGRKQYPFDGIIALAHYALEYGRVLTVYGKYGCAVGYGQLIDKFSGHNKRLFIGQTYLLMRFNGMYCGF